MKKTILYVFTLIITLCLSEGCDKGFNEININKVNPSSLDPVFLLNNVVIGSTYSIATLIFEMAIVQQMVTLWGGALQGGNLNQGNFQSIGRCWTQAYGSVLKYTAAVKQATFNDSSRSNLYNLARIWNSYGAIVLTVTYGD